MSDEQSPEDRPVANGLIALVAVALGVGLIVALVALMATKVLGVGGDDGSTQSDGLAASMYLPTPSDTIAGGPRITLTADESEETESASESDEPEETETSEEPEETESSTDDAKQGDISLQAAATEVEEGEQIYFSGVYPSGEGAILQVQRFTDGSWEDFNANFTVTNGTFSSYIFTGQTGVNRLRVINKEDDTVSNEIRVRVGG